MTSNIRTDEEKNVRSGEANRRNCMHIYAVHFLCAEKIILIEAIKISIVFREVFGFQTHARSVNGKNTFAPLVLCVCVEWGGGA